MSNAINIERAGNTSVIRFSRPEIRSPLSIAVLEQLHTIVDAAAVDTAVERLVFTGQQDVFASGADLREIALVKGDGAKEFALRGQSLMTKVAGLAVPTFAAVNGYCFGGALDLALACDHRIASPQATFSHPGAGLGIITGWGGTQRLPRLVGQPAALEMLFTGKRVNAAEALRLQLIDKIADDPLEAAIAFERN